MTRFNPPAFTIPSEDVIDEGMSLRDWFAGQALTTMSSVMPNVRGERESDLWRANLAEAAYAMADAMLVRRQTWSDQEIENKTIERAAEGMWREESWRAAGFDRRIKWAETDEGTKEKWRSLARVALYGRPLLASAKP